MYEIVHCRKIDGNCFGGIWITFSSNRLGADGVLKYSRVTGLVVSGSKLLHGAGQQTDDQKNGGEGRIGAVQAWLEVASESQNLETEKQLVELSL